ncbi:MAG: WYL domain-containing protein, partial [Mariniphaga sp.]
NLYGMLHAIKNQLQIKFIYQKYWEEELSQRIAEPYALKEFQNRWYVLANDLKDNKIKSFALDRLTNLEITRRKYNSVKQFNVNEHFKYCFGIISPFGKQPQEIVLSFDPHEGKYIKSLPLHESQVILEDTVEELLIKLNLVVTHDFLMEILSHGEYVKVLKPENLVTEVKSAFTNALLQY